MDRKQEISKELFMVADGLLLGACLWISYLIRSTGIFKIDLLSEIPSFSNSFWILLIIIPLSPLLLDLQSFYNHPLTQSLEQIFTKILRAGFWLVLTITIGAVFGRLEVPSRSVLILFLIFAPLLLILRVILTRKLLILQYEKGMIGEQSIIVGHNDDINVFLRYLTATEKLELQIAKHFDLDTYDAARIKYELREHPVGRVIFASPESPENVDLPTSCESEGMDVWILAKNINGLVGNPHAETAGRNRVLVFKGTSLSTWEHIFKRSIDVVGALTGLILLFPVCAVIALVIRLTSPGPVIFRQVRSGKRGKRFNILKFRSMVVNAPELHGDLAHRNEMEGPVFKIENDPRVTPFGSFLRRTSLDEVPQLVNVLMGEMSLVGPRPLPDYETAQIEHSLHRRRLSVKPGLTCLWQISGRNSISSFEEWVMLDIEYIDRACLLLDLWIILKTIPVVIFRKGAK